MGPALPCAELLLQLSRGNTSQGCQGPALLCPCHWGQFSQEGQLSLKQLSKATGASTPMALGGNEGYFLPPPASVCSSPLSPFLFLFFPPCFSLSACPFVSPPLPLFSSAVPLPRGSSLLPFPPKDGNENKKSLQSKGNNEQSELSLIATGRKSRPEC